MWRTLALLTVLLAACVTTRQLSPMERLLDEGRYAEVLEHRSRAQVQAKNLHSETVVHDIAQVMVHGHAAPALLCGPVLDRYPESIAPAVQVCRMLRTRLAGGEITDEELEALEQSAQASFPRERYLVDVMRRVQSATLPPAR